VVRRLLVLPLFACLFVAGTAAATHQDPKQKLTKVDTARARAMLVKKTDLSAGFVVRPGSGEDPHIDCPAAVSESDLTLTGEADGLVFALGVVFVESAAQVYETVSDANASWRRGTSTAGTTCVSALLSREFAKQGIRLMSLRKITFPHVAPRTASIRIKASAASAQGPVPIYIDLVALMHSRAHATVLVGSALVAPPRAEELRLARLVAGRMAKAMRGTS
jgi:hypothetical protein